MKPIIPTIFAHNKKEFKERFDKLISISNNLQIDFMDGKFVKSKSVSVSEVPNLKKYKNNFEAHLMAQNAQGLIKKLSQKGFKKIIFHYESLKESKKIYKLDLLIKKQKMKSFIAINPETNVEMIFPFLPILDGVLFLGVNPGREHQKFKKNVFKKIQALRKINKKIIVQVDGGVNLEIIKQLAKLKVNFINSGSLIADSKSPKETFNKLNSLFNKSKR